MSTVAELIDQLQRHHKPDDPIIFQYMVSNYTSYAPEDFAEITDYLMGNDQFGQDSAELFIAWMSEAASIIEELKEDCIHCDGKGYDIQDNNCDYCDGTGKDND